MLKIEDFTAQIAELSKKVKFESYGHKYTVNGEKMPSVTTVLDQVLRRPALEKWMMAEERKACIAVARKIALGEIKPDQGDFAAWFERALGPEYASAKQSRFAKNLGTEVHALIEWWLQGKLNKEHGKAPVASEQASSMFGEFCDWADSAEFFPLAVEIPIFSDKHRYAGRVDVFASVFGKPTIVDWKTASQGGPKLFDEMLMQSEAYRAAAEEQGLGSWEGLVVKLPKNGDPVIACPVGQNHDQRERFFHLVAAHWCA